MNIVHELEKVLYHPTYMGQSDKAGVNLAVNDILNKIEELGFEIVEREVLDFKNNIDKIGNFDSEIIHINLENRIDICKASNIIELFKKDDVDIKDFVAEIAKGIDNLKK